MLGVFWGSLGLCEGCYEALWGSTREAMRLPVAPQGCAREALGPSEAQLEVFLGSQGCARELYEAL